MVQGRGSQLASADGLPCARRGGQHVISGQARFSARTSIGQPVANFSRMISTVIRVPRMTGLPSMTSSSIRSSRGSADSAVSQSGRSSIREHLGRLESAGALHDLLSRQGANRPRRPRDGRD